MQKEFKKTIILCLLLTTILSISSCSNNNFNNNNFNKKKEVQDAVQNNVQYQYLFRNSFVLISSVAEAIQRHKEYELDLDIYNETYFETNELLIYLFNIQYEENDLKIVKTERNNESILLDISINSPCYSAEQFFDNEISVERIFIDISRADNTFEDAQMQVGILVINKRYEGVYRSIYYNCHK